MGILDDAIREHLDLKRQHGARDSEIQEIEDDAFGSGERPDPFASEDLFGESARPGEGGGPGSDEIAALETPQGTGVPTDLPDLGNEDPTRLVEPTGSASAPSAPPAEREPPSMPEPPAPEPAAPAPPPSEPAASEPPASPAPAEPPARPEPPAPADSDQSESLADLMAEDEAERPAPPTPPPPPQGPPEPAMPSDAPAARPSEDLDTGAGPAEPSTDQDASDDLGPPEPAIEEPPGPTADLEQDELEPGPVDSVPDPPPPPPEPGTEPPGRARGRVHHPTEEFSPPDPRTRDSDPVPAAEPEGPPSGAPLRPEGASAEPVAPAPDAGGPQLYDFETDEGALQPGAADAAPPPPASPEPADEFEDLGPITDESEVAPAPAEDESFDDRGDYQDDPGPDPAPAPAGDDEDLLAESPEFVEEDGEEGEDLWFEKGPPKDFDFEDE